MTNKVDIQFNLRIPSELKEKIELVARDNNRSINAEITFRLYNSLSLSQGKLQEGMQVLEELLLYKEPTARRKIIHERLGLCLKQINAAGFDIKPDRIAKAIGEEYAEPMEKIFGGLQEPSFTQLEKIAQYLNIVSDWLLFGEKSMFDVKYIRLPRSTKTSAAWLLNQDTELDESNNSIDQINNKKLLSLYFIRNDSGDLVIVKRYEDWYCAVFTTPYSVSESIGATGEADLVGLFSVWKLLYQTSNNVSIQSYILNQESFNALTSGVEHPLSILKKYSAKPWWEDIWDIKNYKAKEYWSGWSSLCERINRIVSSK